MTYLKPKAQFVGTATAAVGKQSIYNKMGNYTDRLDLVIEAGFPTSDVADPAAYEADG